MVVGEINGGIFWDIENCRVPADVHFEDIAGNIQKAVRHHHCFRGAITSFSAYGDFSMFPRKLRESCQRTGVKLVDIPNGRKDAADKAILVDMFFYAMDNKPPSFIVLISGDRDFLHALHILGQRGYTIMVVQSGVDVSPALINAGHYVLDWHTVASGESFVSQNPFVDHHSPDLVDCRMSRCEVSRPDILNENETALSKANIQPENPSFCINVSDLYCNSSSSSLELHETSQSPTENTSSNLVAGHRLTPTESALERNVTCSGKRLQPRRKELLKRQIKWLIESLGGSLLLELLCSEYHKKYGFPLYPHDYGFKNVAELLDKFRDNFIIKGSGNEQRLYVRISPNACEGSIPLAEKNKDTTPAKKVDTNKFSNLGSDAFDGLTGQAKHVDPQLYAQLTEAKIEEPKLGASLNEARIEDSGSGTDMSQDDIATPFRGRVSYGPEQRGVALVHPPVYSGRVVAASAVERGGQQSIALLPSSGDWKRGPPISSLSLLDQSRHYSDDSMTRDTVQKISSRSLRRRRCMFCRGKHIKEDCPMGEPVCFQCGQSGHVKSACPHLFRDRSKQQKSTSAGRGDSGNSQHHGGPSDSGHLLDNFETFEPSQSFAGHSQALAQSELPAVVTGTYMSQDDTATPFGGRVSYGPEHIGEAVVHPPVDSGLHLGRFASVQGRVVVASAVERRGQHSIAVLSSSGDWRGGLPISSFSQLDQSRHYSDDSMTRGSVQKISTRSRRQHRCMFCGGKHIKEDCPMGEPVCFCCGHWGHIKNACPQLFRDGSKQQRSTFTGRGGSGDSRHRGGPSDSGQLLDNFEIVEPSQSIAGHSQALAQSEFPAVVTGTDMSQGDVGTLFGGRVDYGPEQRGVRMPVHPLVDTGLHLERSEFVLGRVVGASAAECKRQYPKAVVPSSGDWKGGPLMSSFMRPTQRLRYSDDTMMRGSIQKISTRSRRRHRCMFCGGKHLKEDCPMGEPVCFCCGQAGHRKSDCPQLREGSELQRSMFTARGDFDDSQHSGGSSDSGHLLESSEAVEPSPSFAGHSQVLEMLEVPAVVTGEANEKVLDVCISPNACEGSIPIVDKKDITPAKEVDMDRFSNSCSWPSNKLPVQAKNVDPPQVYAIPTETKSEEPKFGLLLKDAKIEDSAFREPLEGYEYFT